MRKNLLASSLIVSSFCISSLSAGVCSDGLKFDFTFYGGPDKSYVVTKNTFKTFTAEFPEEKLLNSTLEIDATSLDTSADMNNIDKTWPAPMANVRNNNTVNHFFKKFQTDPAKVYAKIVDVNESSINVEFKINGVTKQIPFEYVTQDDKINASGKLDVLDFGTDDAWQAFRRICEKAYHHGASYSQIDINFSVPASCK